MEISNYKVISFSKNEFMHRLLEKSTEITKGNPSNGIIQETIISPNITQIYTKIGTAIKIKSINTIIKVSNQLKFIIRCANDYQ